MNLPNKLTVLRIVLILPFLLVLYLDVPGALLHRPGHLHHRQPHRPSWTARSPAAGTLVTDFGKFADPLADKMLVVAAMLWFVENGRCPVGPCSFVILREFAVSGLLMVASDQGRVIAAGWVREGEDRLHHGVHRAHVPAHPRSCQHPVRGGDRGHHPLVRGGVLCQKPGLPAGICNIRKAEAGSAGRGAGSFCAPQRRGPPLRQIPIRSFDKKFYFWPSIRLQVGPLLGIIGVRDTNRVKSWRHEKRREDVTKECSF